MWQSYLIAGARARKLERAGERERASGAKKNRIGVGGGGGERRRARKVVVGRGERLSLPLSLSLVSRVVYDPAWRGGTNDNTRLEFSRTAALIF